MTVFDVKNAVLGYGYTKDLQDNDELFYTVLNLAIKEVNRIRPMVEVVTVVHEPVDAVAAFPDVILCKPGNPVTYTAVARSVAFEVSGHGSVTVTGADIDGADEKSWNVDNGWMRLVAESNEISKISLDFFSSDLPFYIRNVSFYDVPPFSKVVGGGAVVEYDLASTLPRLSSALLPVMKNGVEMDLSDPRAVLREGRYLRLPKEQRGTYEIRCEVFPERFLSSADDNKQLPLAEDLAELVPLLVASYIWLDDEPEKAARYKSLYDLAAREIRRPTKIAHCIDRKGWT